MRAMSEHAQVTVRRVSRDEATAFLDVDQWAFTYDPTDLDADLAVRQVPWDRAFAAHLPGSSAMDGIYASYTFDLTVPGGAQPGTTARCAGLTWVGVHPEHRRKGILRTMIAHHLEDARAAGEPVSALFAAEAGIYGRFGYGLAARAARLTLPRGAQLREVPGTDGLRLRLERADAAKHSPVVESVRDAVRTRRPGEVSRPFEGLRHHLFADEKAWRDGGETLRFAVVEDAATGEPRGYCVFRRKGDWGDSGPAGTVLVRELTALDAAAARVLWGRLSDLDLMARLKTDVRPLDDPLFWLLTDVRAATPALWDNLWVRLVDVPAALAARRWATDVDVVLDVTDADLPGNAGRWRLRGGPTSSTCERTDGEADLTLDVRDLGAAYLGGTPLTALADAGLLRAASGEALWRATTAFASPVAPVCGYLF